MFPGVNGFQWDAGHIIFLGAFFAVATLIAITVARVSFRSLRDGTPKRVESIRWHGDFHDLPPDERCCRHQITHEVSSRECPNEFDCRHCADHPKFPQPSELTATESVAGLDVPLDRFYHRGHAWARKEPDGTYTVGLDELGARLLGQGSLELPPTGSHVFVNGAGWWVKSNGDRLRVLSPIDGEVVATNGDDWFLRVKPDPGFRTDHLLKGPEVLAWLNREFERLQLSLGGALADGGTLVDDLESECKGADLDAIRGQLFLQP